MRRLHFADECCVPCGGDSNFLKALSISGCSMRKEEIIDNRDDFGAGG